MVRLALMMLVGDRKKFLGIVLGVAFSAGLIAFQMSAYFAVMKRTGSIIRDTHPTGIWVMDPGTLNVDAVRPLASNDLHRVRGVEGLRWAVPFYKDLAYVEPGEGRFSHIVLLGLDDATLVGLPHAMIMGRVEDVALPDAVIVDELGYSSLWPGEEPRLGRTFEIDDRRAVLVGICKTSPAFQSLPIFYTRFGNALSLRPHGRRPLSFVLAEAAPNADPDEVCRRIKERTGLLALTGEAFTRRTADYYFHHTAIPINFFITICVGFVVGVAFSGQMFYLVTLENLKHFASLKAVGTGNRSLVGMVLLQALTSGLLGYGVGMGLTALLFEALVRTLAQTAGLFLVWEVMAVCAVSVLAIMLISSLFSVHRVLVLDAASVFRR